MKKQAVLIVAAIAVGVIVALLAWLGSGSQTPVEAATVAAPRSTARNSTNSSALVANNDDDHRSATANADSSSSAPIEPAAAHVLGEGLDVLVLDKKSEQPIADAKLTYLAVDNEDAEYFAGLIRKCELDELLAKNGTHYPVDEQGRGRVPAFVAGAAIVVANAGDQWGYATIGKLSDPPVKVMLGRDSSLSALVVDDRGAPVADAVVVLRAHGNNDRWTFDTLKTRSRASDGLAVLSHAGASLASTELGLDNQWSITLGAVLEKPVEVALVPSKLPTEPVRLVVPATGECEVSVLDPEGQPYTDKVDVTLRLITREEELGDPREQAGNFNRPANGQSLELNDIVGGHALFHHVQPGTLLEASVQRHGNYQQHSERGPGPSSSGQRASITVRLGTNTPIVAGRAVDEQGVALAGAKLHSKLSYIGQPMWSNSTSEFKTDATGRFLVDVGESPNNSAPARELTIYSAGDDGVQLAAATRELPPTLGPGLHELGDFTLQPAPIIVAGKVVDEQGQPVKHAWITPAVKQTWNEGEEDSFWWQDLWDLRCQSDASGNFALRGRMQARELGLRADGDKCKSDVVIALAGARDVVLRLMATGEIAGQVLFDASVARETLQLHAMPVAAQPGNDQQSQWTEPTTLDEEGKFVFKDLKAGNYTIVLQTSEANTQLASIDNVHLERGESVRDPRLNPLDMRGGLHPIVLTIFNEQNEPIGEGNVGISKSGASNADAEYQYFEHGKLVVFLPGGQPIDLQVMCDGYRSTSLHNVATDQRIVLKRTVPVRLVLARGVKLPAPPIVIGARLEAAGPGASGVNMWSDNSASFESNGELVLPSGIVGPATIVLTITYQSDDNWMMTNFNDGITRAIEIEDTQREQRFEVSFDPAKMNEEARAITPDAKRRDG